MRWFDDLWLKEGFAQYMAYKTLAALRPNEDIWQHFYQSIKPAAYAIDETQGTTPIYQEIRNLDSAKSAYGAIVYSKAPGVLRQLNYVIGDDAFRRGLQIYLAQHKYGNATWSDLIAAFQSASGRNLTAWADMWIRHRGMPRIDVSFTAPTHIWRRSPSPSTRSSAATRSGPSPLKFLSPTPAAQRKPSAPTLPPHRPKSP